MSRLNPLEAQALACAAAANGAKTKEAEMMLMLSAIVDAEREQAYRKHLEWAGFPPGLVTQMAVEGRDDDFAEFCAEREMP